MTTKNIWELIAEPLEATVYVLTNKGYQPLKLVCPDREEVNKFRENLPEVMPPTKEVETGSGKKKSKQVVEDLNDADYLKAREEREFDMAIHLIDSGLVDKPSGDFGARKDFYKKLPAPVIQQVLLAINHLLEHELPPSGLPDGATPTEV